ncbi:MAG: hypothetical protein LBT00_03950 [Spirochaetaceae bacterium]|nr:hypothetical protein [Spirochaetaceae bacterium]
MNRLLADGYWWGSNTTQHALGVLFGEPSCHCERSEAIQRGDLPCLDRFAANGNYVVTAISRLAAFSQSAEIATPNSTLFGQVLFRKCVDMPGEHHRQAAVLPTRRTVSRRRTTADRYG